MLTKLRQEWRSRKGWERSWLGVAKSYLYHDYLLRTLQRGECGKLYGLQDGNGVLLTVALMLEDAREAFYMIGANSAEGDKAGASFRTFWELCRVYQDRGLERLNFGGVPLEAEHDGHEEHGVFRFKKGFGIEPTRRISLVCACPAHNQLGFQDGSR